MASTKHNIEIFFVELDFLLELFLSDEPLPKEEREKITASIRASSDELRKQINALDQSKVLPCSINR